MSIARVYVEPHGGDELLGVLTGRSLDELWGMLLAGLTQHVRWTIDPPEVVEM